MPLAVALFKPEFELTQESRLKLPAPSEAPDSEQLDAAVLTLARGRWAAGPGFESPARSATRTGSCSVYYDFRVRSSRRASDMIMSIMIGMQPPRAGALTGSATGTSA